MNRLLLIVTLLVLAAPAVQAQGSGSGQNIPAFTQDPAYYSDRAFRKKSIADGNRIRITFHNTGLLAGTGEIRGEWPKGTGFNYIGDVLPLVALEVPVDTNGDGQPDQLVRRGITVSGPRSGVQQPLPGRDKTFTFEPVPGFAARESERPAVANDPGTWPAFWPDQPDWIDPATGQAQWNGFFGRGIQNADFETYFWVDDHNDDFLFERYGFLPDPNNPERHGQGLVMKVRGLQWSQFLAQDAMFWIYELTNVGKTIYPRVAVGLTVGTLAGGDGDSQDDLAFFDQLNRIVYSYDAPPFRGAQGQNVGIVGYAFMESPGNPLDGIDNDGDSDKIDINGNVFVPANMRGEGNIFTPVDFQPRTIQPGDPLVLIDANTFERTITYMANGPMTVVSQGITYNLTPGMMLEETQRTIRGQIDQITVTDKDLIDNDLDGLIDEDISLHFERRAQNFQGEPISLPAVRYKNYVGFANDIRGREATRTDSLRHGLLNPMIDEAADDGIDNDGDWSRLSDDVGADGRAGTGDQGEGDGRPTRGEPNFEHLDVDETDQVGLSSFYYFTPPNALNMGDNEQVWQFMTPGFFTTNRELQQQQANSGVDGDFIFSSGYFRLEPGQTLRFSMALVFGNGDTFGQKLDAITSNTRTIQEIYDRNYNFARPPDKPTLYAVPGDKQVTLYWDAVAENSFDPFLRTNDFEGYKIYKSTDPTFLDPARITDATGQPRLLAPIAQYDLRNGIDSIWVGSSTVIQRANGVPFLLGRDTGLVHKFVDNEVQNGRTYYYAITAYDRGSFEFYPAENSFTATVFEDGTVIPDQNVVAVTPNAASAGYVAGGLLDVVSQAQGNATGTVFAEVLDPRLLDDDATYTISFSGGTNTRAADFTVTSATGNVLVDAAPIASSESQIFDGIRLQFNNNDAGINQNATGLNNPEGKVALLAQRPVIASASFEGNNVPFDYEIRFSDQIVGRSIATRIGSRGPQAQARDTYFTVHNVTEGREVEFAFLEGNNNGRFDNAQDFIFIYDEVNGQTRVPTYALRVDPNANLTQAYPVAGDVFTIASYKPFRANDRYTFTTRASTVDDSAMLEEMEKIRVVPNPYVVAADWEPRLPPTITSGRGERRIDFTHIPAGSTIRIYTVRGELLRELQHDGVISDGTVSWDLRTREGLEVAYGVYFYHVEAPNGAEKTGKFAIIK